jgi:hypothetical protein
MAALLPAKAAQLNANCSWGCAWAPSSASDQALLNNQALLDLQLRNGILNPGGVSESITNYNGTVNQTYTGPSSSSGANVTNIDNLNSTNVTATASGGSNVGVNTSTTQKANGSTQSGAATSNAATIGNGVFDAANTISTGNH